MSTSRMTEEIVFHDLQAARRALRFTDVSRLVFEDDDYLDHETWIRPALARLGNLKGLKVLDLGCGHGMASVMLARRGARVTALELSSGYLREAVLRAQANQVSIRFVRADGQRLPFASESFDRIWGNAVLHHLDPDVAGKEIRRVLRQDGLAVFSEPWGNNLLLALARKWLPYPGKERSRDECPLQRKDLKILQRQFPNLEFEGHQLLGMVRRLIGDCATTRLLHRLDGWLLHKWPLLQRFCRYAVLTLPMPRYNAVSR